MEINNIKNNKSTLPTGISYEEISNCKFQVRFNPDVQTIKQKRSEAVAEIFKMSQSAIIKGYRKGKAPLEAVKVHCKKQIDNELKNKLTQECMSQYMFETKAKPISNPEIKSVSLKEDKFNCEMVITQQPTFELGQYKDFEIPRPAMKSVQDMTEMYLQQLRSDYGETTVFGEDDYVNTGDKITLDLTNPTDPRLCEEGILYQVGNSERPMLVDDLIGMKVGEIRTLSDGKTQATISMGFKVNMLPLDDTLAKACGRDTIEELRSEAAGIFTQRVQQEEKQSIQNQIFNHLLTNHPFEIPEILVENQMRSLAAQYQKKEFSDKTEYLQFHQQATNLAKLLLIFEKVREAEIELEWSDQEVVQYLKNKMDASGENGDEFIKDAERTGTIGVMIEQTRQSVVIDWIEQHCKIVD